MATNKENNTEIVERLLKEKKITQSEFNQLKPRKKGSTIPVSVIKQATKEVVNTQPKTEEDKSWNGICTNHIFKIARIHKPDLESVGSVNRCLEDYFAIVSADKVKPSVCGIAMALGISRTKLIDYASGKTHIATAETMRQALQCLEMFDEMSLRDSTNAKSNPVALMFLMKNNHGYTDKSEVVHSENNMELSDKELQKKYAKEIEIIDADVKEK